MSDYTPTTEDVRQTYLDYHQTIDPNDTTAADIARWAAGQHALKTDRDRLAAQIAKIEALAESFDNLANTYREHGLGGERPDDYERGSALAYETAAAQIRALLEEDKT